MHARVSQCIFDAPKCSSSMTQAALLKLLSHFGKKVCWMEQVLKLRLSSGCWFQSSPSVVQPHQAWPSGSHVLQLWMLSMPAAVTPSACWFWPFPGWQLRGYEVLTGISKMGRVSSDCCLAVVGHSMLSRVGIHWAVGLHVDVL